MSYKIIDFEWRTSNEFNYLHKHRFGWKKHVSKTIKTARCFSFEIHVARQAIGQSHDCPTGRQTVRDIIASWTFSLHWLPDGQSVFRNRVSKNLGCKLFWINLVHVQNLRGSNIFIWNFARRAISHSHGCFIRILHLDSKLEIHFTHEFVPRKASPARNALISKSSCFQILIQNKNTDPNCNYHFKIENINRVRDAQVNNPFENHFRIRIYKLFCIWNLKVI